MVKLNPQQERILDRIDELHEEVVAARRTFRKRIEEQFAKEIDGLLRKRSRAANEGLAAGIPKSRIGRALGTSDWGTITDILALTADEFDPAVPTGQSVSDGRWLLHRDDAGRPASATFFRWMTRSAKEEVTGELRIDLEPGRFGGYTFNRDQFMANDLDYGWLAGVVNEISEREVA